MAARAIQKLIPLFDRVLVQRAEAISRTESGVVIPEKAQKRVARGTIVAVGPGIRKENGETVPLNLKVGDTVLLPDYGGSKVELDDDKKYQLFRESEILALIE